MQKDALELISRLACTAAEAKLVSVPGDGRTAYVAQNGTLTTFHVAPPPRQHHVNSVDDLISAAKRWNVSPVVWISDEQIVLVPDDSDRRDRITLKLVKSRAHDLLWHLLENPKLSQVDLIRLLRVHFVGAVKPAGLLAAVRQIRFRQTSSGDSSIQHGNESLGRAIEIQVSGAGDIPERVEVELALFANPGEREKLVRVACDLEIVTAEQAFRLQPLPDELERVSAEAMADLHDTITTELADVPVFFGSP